MAKLPAFQFYPGDWMKDSDLRVCSIFARGLLVDLLCLMFEAKCRGKLCRHDCVTPWSNVEIVNAVTGSSVEEKLAGLAELELNGVLKRDSSGILYSARMVNDEIVRQERIKAGSKGGSKTQANHAANGQANGQAKSGSSSSSSSSSSDKKNIRSQPIERPDGIDEQHWQDWLTVRRSKGAGPVTKTVITRMSTQARKAGITLGQAVEIAAGRSWQAFEAGWYEKDKPKESIYKDLTPGRQGVLIP